MSALLQECTSHHPSCFLRLLYSPGMAFFRLLCVGERKFSHISVKSVYAPPFFFFPFFPWFVWGFFYSMLIDFKVQAFQPSAGL